MCSLQNIELIRTIEPGLGQEFGLFWKKIKEGDYTLNKRVPADIGDIQSALKENKAVHFMASTHSTAKLEVLACGQGKTILLINGFGYIATQWLYQLNEWVGEYNLIVIHIPGSGLSQSGKGLSFGELSEDIIEVLEMLHIEWPIHIIGSSWGGLVGQAIAAEFSERVASLTLACSFCEYLPDTDNLSVHEKIRKDFDNIDKNEFYPFALDCELVNILEVKKYAVAQKRSFSTIGILPRIHVPTLVISGKKDCVIDPAQSLILHSNIGGSTLWEINDAGHFPNITHSDAFSKKVLGFIQGQEDINRSKSFNKRSITI